MGQKWSTHDRRESDAILEQQTKCHMTELRVDGRIYLILIKKRGGSIRSEFNWHRIGLGFGVL